MTRWSVFMLVASGLFAGGTVVAATRIPSWLRMPLAQFRPDFARVIAVADKVQPALLLLALSATVVFAFRVEAGARWAASASAAGLVVIMAASGAVLVPMQRRIIGGEDPAEVMSAQRIRWVRGHLGRSAIAVLSFTLAIVAGSP
jgi:anthrone oxygenase-like protein